MDHKTNQRTDLVVITKGVTIIIMMMRLKIELKKFT